MLVYLGRGKDGYAVFTPSIRSDRNPANRERVILPPIVRETLILARRTRGIRLKALARRLGISPGGLAKWQAGKRRPSPAQLAAWQDAVR